MHRRYRFTKKQGRALLAGVLAGLAAPATIGQTGRYELPQGTDLDRMRGDAMRVGNTFRTVMQREHEASRQAK